MWCARVKRKLLPPEVTRVTGVLLRIVIWGSPCLNVQRARSVPLLSTAQHAQHAAHSYDAECLNPKSQSPTPKA